VLILFITALIFQDKILTVLYIFFEVEFNPSMKM